MGTSLLLFRVREIEVRVHWSFVLIIAYGAFTGNNRSGGIEGAIYGVVVILLLFVCVTLHEFGHAFVAQYYKIRVPHITLLPIGGVASLERMPDKPSQEFAIAIAGPLVNFAIVLLAIPFIFLTASLETESRNLSLMASNLRLFTREPGISSLLISLAMINLTLGLFNLLPAFPMDGGRMLRALLALMIPFVTATRIAVIVGRVMAGLVAVWSVFNFNIFGVMVAFFIYVGGSSELESVQSRAILKNVRAGEALTPNAVSLYTSERASRAIDLIMHSYQTDYPVLDLNGRFVGVLTRAHLVRSLKEQGADARVVDVMLPAKEIPICGPEVSLADIWETMAQRGARLIAVQDRTQFLGLLTIDDITEVSQVMGAMMTHREGTDAQPPSASASISPTNRDHTDREHTDRDTES